jgi:hypothetical protein
MGDTYNIFKLTTLAGSLIEDVSGDRAHGLAQLGRLYQAIATDRPLLAYALLSDLYCWFKLRIVAERVLSEIKFVIGHSIFEALDFDKDCDNKQISIDEVWQLREKQRDEKVAETWPLLSKTPVASWPFVLGREKTI